MIASTLFFKCVISNRFISNITILINTLNVGTVNLNEKNMMFEFNMGGKHELLLNMLIFISKCELLHFQNYLRQSIDNFSMPLWYLQNVHLSLEITYRYHILTVNICSVATWSNQVLNILTCCLQDFCKITSFGCLLSQCGRCIIVGCKLYKIHYGEQLWVDDIHRVITIFLKMFLKGWPIACSLMQPYS
jgi:hypothetical protein